MKSVLLEECYAYDDVLLVPGYSDVESRTDPSLDTSTDIGGIKLKIPLIASPMDTVSEVMMCVELGKMGGMGVLHRFLPIDEQVKMANDIVLQGEDIPVVVAVGVTDYEKSRFEELLAVLDPHMDMISIDIANGHHSLMKQMVQFVKSLSPKLPIMAGNVATGEGFQFMADLGINAVRVGIGSGCFGANTNILMSNGTLKKIVDVKSGDRVINRDGNPVTVKKLINSGFKKVKKIRTSNSAEPIYVTQEHNYWVGDLKNQKHIDKIGKAITLEKPNKDKSSKINWMPVSDFKISNVVLLTPTKINFDLPAQIKIDVSDFIKYGKKSETSIVYKDKNYHRFVESNYDLGYIFGTFLGNGHAFINTNGRSQIGNVKWYFGLDEMNIVSKLAESMKRAFNLDLTYKVKKSIIEVSLYSKPIAHMLFEFGKKTEKHLPEKYYATDKNYLLGLYDGLIDSDGSREKSRKDITRDSFSNTSERLVELFNFCCLNLGKTFSNSYSEPTIGGLSFCDINNCNPSYHSRTHTSNRNVYGKYFYSEILSIKNCEIEIETWDLEVDCPTHSFVANYSAVHNSICSTRIQSGFGVPVLSSVMDCYDYKKIYPDVAIIADGGIKYPKDLVIALAAGADAIMSGSLFAGTKEAPGDLIYTNDSKAWKKYRGMASLEVQQERRGGLKPGTIAEGVSQLTEYKGSLDRVVSEFVGGLKLGMAYGNAKTISDLRKIKMIKLTNAGITESHAFGTRRR